MRGGAAAGSPLGGRGGSTLQAVTDPCRDRSAAGKPRNGTGTYPPPDRCGDAEHGDEGGPAGLPGRGWVCWSRGSDGRVPPAASGGE